MGRMNPGAPPVLVIGLDMGDGGLIRHLSRCGRLPHFNALIDGGVSLELESPAQALHTSTWPTFATGVLPGRHGVYYPYQPTPGVQFARQIGDRQYGTTTIWQRAAAADRRVVVYDVPETFPERGFTGRGIYDFGTWAHYGCTSAQPPRLLDELKAQFGPYPLGYEAMRLGFEQPRGIEERLLRSVRHKAATARWLLDRAAWDLAIVVFGETHCAGHYLWPRSQSSVEEGDPSAFEALFAMYVAVDEALGELAEKLPKSGTLMVVSGDGVRPNRCGWHLLPAVLDRLGCTSTGRAAGEGARPSLLATLPRLVPTSIKKRVATALPMRVRNRLSLIAQAGGLDWSRTRAFALPSDLEGCVRINLRGREPEGIVEPGAQYADLCEEIRRGLEELVNPATGKPAVRHVWVRNEIFPGPCQEELPDLMVTWQDDAPIEALASPRVGVVEGVNPDRRPGTHSTAGFLIARGAELSWQCAGRARLVDVPATLLRHLGVPGAAELDGRAIIGELDGVGSATE